MRHQPKVALFIFGPLGRTSRPRGRRLGLEPLVHGQSQRPNLLAFLADAAGGDTGTRTRVNVMAPPILAIEPRCPLCDLQTFRDVLMMPAYPKTRHRAGVRAGYPCPALTATDRLAQRAGTRQ
jgi:hypothetical protein